MQEVIRKPDFTAWFVLQGAVAAMHLPEFYSKDNETSLKLYETLASEAGKTRFISKIINKLPYSFQYRIGEFVTNSGRIRHFYLRKKEIEKQVRSFLVKENISQIVVLGAGLDTLALRLASEYKNIKFIEIDRQESQFFKKYALSKNNIKIPDNMELLSGDLQNPLSDILRQSKFHDYKAKTLWIAEGLFMFIPQEAVEKLFRQIGVNSAADSKVIFTTLGMEEQGSGFARITQKFFLKKEKCQFRWVIPYEKVADFLQKLNFMAIEQINCKLLHKGYIDKKFDINHKIGDDIHIAKLLS